jgi:sialate O-acetylesterase
MISVLAFAAMTALVQPRLMKPELPLRHDEVTTVQGMFTDNMVLQRDKPIPIWGTAAPGQKIKVVLHDQSVTTVAGERGTWSVTLKPMSAGGPYTLDVTGDQLIQKQNVAIGEVWLCSGQSNMEFHLGAALNGADEVAAASNPDIRLYHVYHRTVDEPLRDMSGVWSTCRPETAKNFSAVAYFFGRALYQKLHVPIGLIESDWGGTPAEAWTPRAALLAQPSLASMVTNYLEGLKHLSTTVTEYQKRLDAYNKLATVIDPGNKGLSKGWAEPDLNDNTWQDIGVPGNYKSLLRITDNGAFWYRKTIDVPASSVGADLKLELGAIDDYDTTYFNGTEVGRTGSETPDSFQVARIYSVPAGLVKPGKNVIAVRVWNNAGAGGLLGPKPMQITDSAGFAVPLDGTWKFAVEYGVQAPPPKPPRPLAPGDPWVPSSLYNGMIAGILPYPIRGVIWYQGESNADRPTEYRTLFPTMISAWRKAFGQGDFPFYFVQLANYAARAPEPVESDWALLREAQAMALRLPNTGMAVAIDVGSADTIHPQNKQEVGHRLALLALNRTYGQGGEDQGPTYQSMAVESGAIRLKFTHNGGGLFSHGGPLIGFEIAGEDRKFVWADARIERDTVVVSSKLVPAPVAVRYGWDINPATSLYNGSNLPASPFRTDDWPSSASETHP